MTAGTNGDFYTPALTNFAKGLISWIDGGTPAKAALVDLDDIGIAVVGAADAGSGKIRLTVTGHSFSNGNRIQVTGLAGSLGSAANGSWAVENAQATTIDLADSSGYAGWTSGGLVVSLEDEFYDDIAAGAKVSVVSLANPVVVDGELRADNVTLPNVSGDQSEGIILFVDGGIPGTDDYLIGLITEGNGLPVTPNGGSIQTTWDSFILAL